ncbi:Protein kinase DC2 [Lucilia cuprina]|nr:Protein kinase DC2 [Lucilia cuprina]
MSAATCSRLHSKMAPTTSSKVNASNDVSLTLKLGSTHNRPCGLSSGYTSRNGTNSSSVGSSESSDPVESDYSEETDEEQHTKHTKIHTENTYEDIDEDEDDDEEDDDDEEEEEDDDTDDDGNETDDEEDDTSEDNSSVETAKGVRKYSLDDYQIIKTVGINKLEKNICLKHSDCELNENGLHL